jgi:ATP-binding cassette subfamily B protein
MIQHLLQSWRKSRAAKREAIANLSGSDDETRYKPIEWSLIRRLFSLLAPYKRRYVLGISLGALMVILEMLGPLFIGHLVDYTTAVAADIDQVLDKNLFATLVNFILGRNVRPGESEAIAHVVGMVLLWAGALGAALIIHRATILIMTDAGERVQFSLRRRIFEHLQRLSMSFYDKTKLGRIISRCTSDIGALREINVWGIDQIVKNTLMIVVSAGMLLYTEPRLFLAVAWLGPILYVMNRVYRRKISFAWQVVREWYTRVSTNLAENITGVRVVTAFNRQEPNLKRFDHMQEVNTANNVRAARINGMYQPLLQLIGVTGKIIILAYGGYMVASGSIKQVGSVVAAFLYWDWFMNPILNLGNFHNQLMMAMAGAERVFNLLDRQPEVQDVPDATPLARLQGSVQFEDVTFGYDPARPVLFDIDFAVKPGQMIALVGHTGSGKSSIISLIARFYQPQKGRVLVDGRDIRHVTGDSLHRQMGLVLQTNYLFTGTVIDNIRYVRPDATETQVIEAARAIGSHDAIMGLKDGFATQVGERGANMSLGQRQLICFTRAFLADPRIFLLDEATSSVDTETELLIQRSLEKLLAGRTTFIVAHRLSTIQRADQILVIDSGRIVERGTHAELLDLGGTYYHLYEQFVKGSAGPTAG